MSDALWAEHVKDIFHEDKANLVPIDVPSGISPANAQQFLIHIILSLGRYKTEMDAMTHPTIRDSLRAVGLIGDESDEESLMKYLAQLTHKYIEEQLV